MLSVIKKKSFICICIAIVGIALCAVLLSTKQERQAMVGQNFLVAVIADSLEDVYGYQFRITYDENAMEFTGTLNSRLDEISTIFSKTMDGYELVGATMIGEKNGVSGRNRAVCELLFTARTDIDLDNLKLSISDVNVVTSDLAYNEGIEGWRLMATLSD